LAALRAAEPFRLASRARPGAEAKILRVTQQGLVISCCRDVPDYGRARACREMRYVMSTGNITSGDGRHTARKNAARDLSARTGMPYAAALRHLTESEDPWQPRHRWLLSDGVRDWIDGRTWRGVSYPGLRTWLDAKVSPVYECWWCEEPGDARQEDSSIELIVSAYDPDLTPATMHLGTHKYHARCKPSSVAWVRRADIPSGPQRIALPASAKPEVAGEFDLDARALLAPGWWYGHDHTGQAMLLVTARVAEDHAQGARAWLTELELHLNSEGLGHPDGMDGGECDWALRIATGDQQWIALRTGQHEAGAARHLLLSALDLPEGWAEAARRDGQVTVAAGPCTTHWDDITPGPGDLAEVLDDLLESSFPVTKAAPGCACAALTANHVAELADAGVLVTAGVRVVAGEN
jgi:hypothetical protein